MIKVNSSNIAAIHYDFDDSSLYIQFNSGRCYRYLDVPHSVYNGFLNTSSYGKYFNSVIKDKFDYEKVDSIPENRDVKLFEGEQAIWFSVSEDEKTIKLMFSDGKSFDIPRNPDGNNVHIPYWVTLRISGSPLLIEHVQAFVQASGLTEGIVAWNGRDFRPVIEEDTPDIEEEKRRLKELSDEERQREERRQRRIELAKKAFSIPI